MARCARGGRGEPGGRYFVTGSTAQHAIRDRALHAIKEVGYRGFGDVTVISDGAEILKRLPRVMPKPTTHIIDWFHIAMKIQPMQQIADHIARSQSGSVEALSTIDKDIRAVKWRLWHGRVDRAIRDLEPLLARLKGSQQESEFSIVRLHSLGLQLLTGLYLGVSPSAYENACHVMGPETAAMVVACTLQRAQHIHSAGGYLRALTEKAEQGSFPLALC